MRSTPEVRLNRRQTRAIQRYLGYICGVAWPLLAGYRRGNHVRRGHVALRRDTCGNPVRCPARRLAAYSRATLLLLLLLLLTGDHMQRQSRGGAGQWEHIQGQHRRVCGDFPRNGHWRLAHGLCRPLTRQRQFLVELAQTDLHGEAPPPNATRHSPLITLYLYSLSGTPPRHPA